MIKAVVGANWGDEGKGKITDMLAEKADIIVRFQGGANAGHTIVIRTSHSAVRCILRTHYKCDRQRCCTEYPCIFQRIQ